MGVAPLYGDYEAQRHWLSLTWHLPPSKWYYHDLEYWGLDYPPLTAYHSYALAWLATKVGGSDWVGLHGVSGVVAPEGDTKLFMRSTVLLTELLLWIPVVVYGWCGVVLDGTGTQRPKRSERTKAIAAGVLLLQPALVLIDNGHFQCVLLQAPVSAASN
jgi:alpha-1,3-glucosyltransferase